jgi:hypothetical protein
MKQLDPMAKIEIVVIRSGAFILLVILIVKVILRGLGV